MTRLYIIMKRMNITVRVKKLFKIQDINHHFKYFLRVLQFSINPMLLQNLFLQTQNNFFFIKIERNRNVYYCDEHCKLP